MFDANVQVNGRLGRLYSLARNEKSALLVVGLAEQLLLSGSSFLYTALVAKAMGANLFGSFSVVWAIATLLETSLWGFFGDALPATSRRVPSRRLPALRGGLMILSLTVSGGLCGLIIAAGVGCVARGMAIGLTVLCAVPFLLLARFQNMFRRICYLDHDRLPTLFSAALFAVTLISYGYIMTRTLAFGPGKTFLGLALASAVASMPILIRAKSYRWPTSAMRKWLQVRIWRTGRWVFATSAISWAGNLGIIPLAGAIAGLSASGSLRTLQTLTTPLSQANAVITSILVPSAAMKKASNEALLMRAAEAMRFFIPLSVLYAIVVAVLGTTFFNAVFGRSFHDVNHLAIVVAVFGYSIESFRFSFNVPLLAMGKTKILFVSQCASIASLIGLLPLFYHIFGFLGMPMAMTAANNVGTLFTSVRVFMIAKQLKRVII
jgi:O-antigen/teichoic acid export membrane protein